MDDSGDNGGDTGDHSPEGPMQDLFGRKMDGPFFIMAAVAAIVFIVAVFVFKP